MPITQEQSAQETSPMQSQEPSANPETVKLQSMAKEHVHHLESAEKPHSPLIRSTVIDSEAYPKYEVEVGRVLFSINNEEAAIYMPVQDETVSFKQDIENIGQPDVKAMINSTFGLGVVLHSADKNGLEVLGQVKSQLVARKDDRYFAYDFRPEYQKELQTLLRFVEIDKPEATPKWRGVPEIKCSPWLVENMSSQLDIAVRATMAFESERVLNQSAETKLATEFTEQLKKAFPDHKVRATLKAHERGHLAQVQVDGADFTIEETSLVGEGSILEESTKARGNRSSARIAQQKLYPVWDAFHEGIKDMQGFNAADMDM